MPSLPISQNVSMQTDVIIVGGGAAGFFTAINIAEFNPKLKIAILERGKEVLAKVRVSGGGRCNVTHAEFIPKELTKNYPRGEKELLGPFHSFMTGDTIEWFEKRGVELKIEADGRMFPVTDSSQTIVDCFLSEVKRLGIQVLNGHSLQSISKEGQLWELQTNQGKFHGEKLMVATGSNPKIWNLLENLGHTIVPPVPSLFTFNIQDKRIEGLMGLATNASVSVLNEDLLAEGPVLITHWGMSGPAILKLSAWGARTLHKYNYRFKIQVNWIEKDMEEAMTYFQEIKALQAKHVVIKHMQFGLPKRLWQRLVQASEIPETLNWASLTKKQAEALARQLTKSIFQVEGKSTFKEEFVTAGGVELKEIHFKTFESKLHDNLYFAGEVLNIDAVTGGFNFQNAWTGGYIAAKSIAE